MATTKKTELIVERKYDARLCRHTVNGVTHVLHCHHYLSLYTQLAEDCAMIDARKLLAETTEDSVHEVLSECFRRQGLSGLADRIRVAEDYYAFAGLGRMKVAAAGPDTAAVVLDHSHVDAGWVKKWGPRDKPVNYVTAGYVGGMLAAIFDLGPRSWVVRETMSIVAGGARSEFSAVRA